MKVERRMKIVIVDDHPLLAHGLQHELEDRGVTTDVVVPGPHDRTRAEAGGTSADRLLVQHIVSLHPDLVLVDLDLPIDNGGLGLVEVLAPDTRVAVLTGSRDHVAWSQCLESGARVVLSKEEPLDRLMDEILAVLDDRPVKVHQRQELEVECLDLRRDERRRLEGLDQLSIREADVLGGLMNGLSAADIAERDCVSVETVRSQIKSVLQKLEVHTQLAAVARAYAAGWRADESAVAAGRGGNRS
jgi:DNA-binding NarL/FixJ family response regulator